jgi:NADH dehydrogenase FAD-containing subunit
MKKLLILGAGTAGTMVANKMSHMLSRDEWKITVVDRMKRTITSRDSSSYHSGSTARMMLSSRSETSSRLGWK